MSLTISNTITQEYVGVPKNLHSARPGQRTTWLDWFNQERSVIIMHCNMIAIAVNEEAKG